MRCCSTSCAKPVNWTFRMLPSILPPCALLAQAKKRAKPGGSCATRFEAPHSRRRQRSAGQFDVDQRKPSWRHSSAAIGRRHIPDSRPRAADHFASPRSSTAIGATTPTHIASACVIVASGRRSHDVELNIAAVWANSAG